MINYACPGRIEVVMKKRNIILILLTCFAILCVFCGLLIYALDHQIDKDKKSTDSSNANNEIQTSEAPSYTPTLKPTAAITAAITQAPSSTVTPVMTQEPTSSTNQLVLGFAGDVNLDENRPQSAKYDASGEDITKCFSENLLNEMRSADLMMVNNEFCYSNRGLKESEKSYTFRAKPSRVNILKEMGVDIVSLANNHTLDYGMDALWDTFDTLENAKIDYVGAGENLNRAKAPVYYTIGEKKIAYLAASHVIYEVSWYATDSKAGMVGTYDPTIILNSIREAKANSDFVVIYVHWGVERNSFPESYQRNLAHLYIDAGADVVIGCHPHVMQGMDYYKGKPIAYSLGNYWFNNKGQESGMVKIYLNNDGTLKCQLLPVMTGNAYTYLLTDQEKMKAYYDEMRRLSPNVTIDDQGYIK